MQGVGVRGGVGRWDERGVCATTDCLAKRLGRVNGHVVGVAFRDEMRYR